MQNITTDEVYFENPDVIFDDNFIRKKPKGKKNTPIVILIIMLIIAIALAAVGLGVSMNNPAMILKKTAVSLLEKNDVYKGLGAIKNDKNILIEIATDIQGKNAEKENVLNEKMLGDSNGNYLSETQIRGDGGEVLKYGNRFNEKNFAVSLDGENWFGFLTDNGIPEGIKNSPVLNCLSENFLDEMTVKANDARKIFPALFCLQDAEKELGQLKAEKEKSKENYFFGGEQYSADKVTFNVSSDKYPALVKCTTAAMKLLFKCDSCENFTLQVLYVKNKVVMVELDFLNGASFAVNVGIKPDENQISAEFVKDGGSQKISRVCLNGEIVYTLFGQNDIQTKISYDNTKREFLFKTGEIEYKGYIKTDGGVEVCIIDPSEAGEIRLNVSNTDSAVGNCEYTDVGKIDETDAKKTVYKFKKKVLGLCSGDNGIESIKSAEKIHSSIFKCNVFSDDDFIFSSPLFNHILNDEIPTLEKLNLLFSETIEKFRGGNTLWTETKKDGERTVYSSFQTDIMSGKIKAEINVMDANNRIFVVLKDKNGRKAAAAYDFQYRLMDINVVLYDDDLEMVGNIIVDKNLVPTYIQSYAEIAV